MDAGAEQTVHKIVKNSIFYLLALLIALGLKYHYSRAPSDGLVWILGPTAGVVEYMSGIRFEKEDGSGFVSRRHQIIIAPACAGVNFLIIAFSMTVFSGLHRFRAFGPKTFWLVISAAGAYFLTIAVNAVRIVTSIYMVTADIHTQWLTPGQLHRIEGIFIYFFALCLFYRALENTLRLCTPGPAQTRKKWIQQDSDFIGKFHSVVVPLFWYLLVSLGIPLLNSAYHKNGSRFVEHGLVTLAVCMVVFLSVFLIQSCCRRLWKRLQFKSTVNDRF